MMLLEDSSSAPPQQDLQQQLKTDKDGDSSCCTEKTPSLSTTSSRSSMDQTTTAAEVQQQPRKASPLAAATHNKESSCPSSAKKKVSFQLESLECHETDYTEEEVQVKMWYTARHFRYWKSRAKKQALESSFGIQGYEDCLLHTYTTCRNAVLAGDYDERIPLASPLSQVEQDALVEHLAMQTPTRLGLEKTTVFLERFSSRKQLIRGILSLQLQGNQRRRGNQICALSQQTSRPARLFAHSIAVALHQAMETCTDSSAEEDEGYKSIDDDLDSRSNHSNCSLDETILPRTTVMTTTDTVLPPVPTTVATSEETTEENATAAAPGGRRRKPRRFQRQLARSTSWLAAQRGGVRRSSSADDLPDLKTTDAAAATTKAADTKAGGRSVANRRMLFGSMDSTRNLLGGRGAPVTRGKGGQRMAR